MAPPAAATAAAAEDADRTVAFRATVPASEAGRPAVMGADNVCATSPRAAGQPGYDAAQRDGLPGQAGQEP